MKGKGYTKVYGDFGEYLKLLVFSIAGFIVENINRKEPNAPLDTIARNLYLYGGRVLGVECKFRRRIGNRQEPVNIFEPASKMDVFEKYCKDKKYLPAIFVTVLYSNNGMSKGFYIYMTLETYKKYKGGGKGVWTLNVTDKWITKYKSDKAVYFCDGLQIPEIDFT